MTQVHNPSLPPVQIAEGDLDAFEREAAKGVHSAFNACMYREQCRVALSTAPTTVISDQAAGEPDKRIGLILTHEQVSALYVTLFHRERPAFGWIEEPLVAIEAALKPAHDAIHDRTFNAMNRQFFGDDRMAFKEAPMPTDVATVSTAPTTGSAPVAWRRPNGDLYDENPHGFSDWTPLYEAAPPANAPVTSVEQMIRAAKRFAVHWSGRSPANQDEAEAVLRKALLAASMGGDKS